MSNIRSYIQHKLNPLHMYCRLRNAGVRNDWAQKVCMAYERYFYRSILG